MEDRAWGAYDVIHAAGQFGRKQSSTNGQTVFPMFLMGYGYNWQFVIGLEGVAIMPDAIPSVGQDCIGRNPKLVGPWHIFTLHLFVIMLIRGVADTPWAETP